MQKYLRKMEVFAILRTRISCPQLKTLPYESKAFSGLFWPIDFRNERNDGCSGLLL